MTQTGKLNFNYEDSYDKYINVLNITKKTNGNYTEMLINRETFQYLFESGGEWVLDKEVTEKDYKIYSNMTLEQALEVYKHSKNCTYTINWVTPLSEV